MSVTLITGENTYANAQEIRRLKSEFLEKNPPDGLEERWADAIDAGELANLISGGSLFSTERMVVLHNPGINKELNEPLAQALENVPDDVQLVLDESKPDKRSRWYKASQKFAKVISKPVLSEHEASTWLEELAQDRGGRIGLDSARYLVQRVGVDQWRLDSELAKLIAHSPKITKESIDKLVEPSLKENIFQLLDYVVKGKSEKATELYHQLLLKDLDAHQFVSMIAWQLHRLALVCTNKAVPSGQLSSELGMPPFAVGRLRDLGQNLSLLQIKKMMDLTVICEAKLKRTGVDAPARAGLLIDQISSVVSTKN